MTEADICSRLQMPVEEIVETYRGKLQKIDHDRLGGYWPRPVKLDMRFARQVLLVLELAKEKSK